MLTIKNFVVSLNFRYIPSKKKLKKLVFRFLAKEVKIFFKIFQSFFTLHELSENNKKKFSRQFEYPFHKIVVLLKIAVKLVKRFKNY